MTEQIAMFCLKAESERYQEICNECAVFGEVGCDHCFDDAMDVAINALEEVQQYRAIGTPEECREAVEKQIPKKPQKTEYVGYRYTDTYRCPTCGGNFSGTGIADYCYHCGQKLDWSDEE